jgi:uncharacterized protein
MRTLLAVLERSSGGLDGRDAGISGAKAGQLALAASTLVQAADGTWLAQLKAAPVDGKANKELIALVTDRFECRKAAVTIKSGTSGRMKLIRIDTA